MSRTSRKQAEKVYALELNGEQILYTISYSVRKSLSISIRENGLMQIKAPTQMSGKEIMTFIESRSEWILTHVEKAKKNQQEKKQLTQQQREHYLDQAMQVFPERVRYYAEQMGVTYNRICLREQKTRWGSCSSRKNLNFNWKLIMMPPEILDYVVVHELSHLVEMNHSKRFWAVVEKYYPQYEKAKAWLKANGGKY